MIKYAIIVNKIVYNARIKQIAWNVILDSYYNKKVNHAYHVLLYMARDANLVTIAVYLVRKDFI